MSNRRDFLKNISLFTAGGLLAGKCGERCVGSCG